MSLDLAQAHAVRVALARHPVAVECARIASLVTFSEVDVVVFESGRAYVVASSEADVLQPRLLTEAESVLLHGAEGVEVVAGGAAVAIRAADGAPIGAITIRQAPADLPVDVLCGLARLIFEALRPGDAEGIREAVADGLRDAVVVVSADMVITWANRAVGSLLGRTPTELIGSSALDLVHPDDVAIAFDAVTRLQEGLEVYRVFVRLARGNGDYERVEVTGSDLSADPRVAGLVLSLRWAEAADELEVSADRSRRMAAEIVAGLHDGIVATDQFGAITMVNGIARTMFGLDPGLPPSGLESTDFALLDTEGRRVNDVLQPGEETDDRRPRELCVVPANGELRYVTTQKRLVRDAEHNLLGSVVVFHDVTDARRAADELRSQALHDQLTGLANRRQLEQRLTALMTAAGPGLVAACFIDLDAFKVVNDTHGHRVGDEIIRIAAKRLTTQLRDCDLLVRQGGDEFVALIVGADGVGEVITAAERMRATLARPYVLKEERFDLTASVGVAVSVGSDLADDLLLRHADIALYAAKARGRDRVEVFDDDLANEVRLEERQRRMLRDNLDNNRLVVHFQPLVDTTTGRTYGYESLARCRDDHDELVSPAAFLEPILRSGLMWELDRAAFALSCEAAAVLAQVSPDTPPIIACNLSAVSLVQPGLVEFIVDRVSTAGIEPGQICIEITESSAFDAGPASVGALKALHDRGFLLALDDFGTGYSSLAHLRDLPLSTVKVDRSFTARLTTPTSERAIAEAIVSLAGDLGLEVVAEGVETAEQLEQAQELGFTSIQGWHYSAALPLQDILTDWI
ncbi:MAG: putative bifunctional diguanylate cyclase/phosphodiesterase [Acidimicrobiales bacterium]